ncbi:unnamed protein product, partial [Prorocentrum cordatum]
DIAKVKTTVQKHSEKIVALGAQCAEAMRIATGTDHKLNAKAEAKATCSSAKAPSDKVIPNFILLRNFADWGTCKQTGIDRTRAEHLITVIVAKVPATTKENMSKDQMKVVGGGKSDTIHPPVRPGYADEVQGDISAALDSLAYTYNGRSIWVQVEREPWIQKRYSAFGRVRAFLHHAIEQVIDGERDTSFQCTWMPNFVIMAIRGGDEAGYIDNNAEVHFSENWAQATFATTAEELK